MGSPRAKIHTDSEGRFYGLIIMCPVCRGGSDNSKGCASLLTVNWTPPDMTRSPFINEKFLWDFNGNLERPTFTPSLLQRWNEWQGEGVPPKTHVCHSFITDGRIQFLGDCTHELAGQTVDLLEVADNESG